MNNDPNVCPPPPNNRKRTSFDGILQRDLSIRTETLWSPENLIYHEEVMLGERKTIPKLTTHHIPT